MDANEGTAAAAAAPRWLDEVVTNKDYPSPEDIADFTPGARGCEVVFREQERREGEDGEEETPETSQESPPRSKRRRSTRVPITPPSFFGESAAAAQSPGTAAATLVSHPPSCAVRTGSRSRLCYVPSHIAVVDSADSPIRLARPGADASQLFLNTQRRSETSQHRCGLVHDDDAESCKETEARPPSRPWQPADDAMIRRRFLLTRGALRPAAFELGLDDLSEDLGRPKEEVRERAASLGVVPVKVPR